MARSLFRSGAAEGAVGDLDMAESSYAGMLFCPMFDYEVVRVGFVYFSEPLGQSIRTQALMAELRTLPEIDEIVGLDLLRSSYVYARLQRAIRLAAESTRQRVSAVRLFELIVE